jgi:hypothetical protein
MSQVGLQQSFKTIVATALSALESLGFKEEPHANGTANGHIEVSSVCPAQFADIWVGVSVTPCCQSRAAKQLIL